MPVAIVVQADGTIPAVLIEGRERAAIREAIALGRAASGAAIGDQGNGKTRHKQLREMENGAKPIPAAKAMAASAMLAQARLDG